MVGMASGDQRVGTAMGNRIVNWTTYHIQIPNIQLGHKMSTIALQVCARLCKK